MTRQSRPQLERLENRLAPAAQDTLSAAIPLRFDVNQQARAGGTLDDPSQVDLYQIQLRAGDEVTAGVQAYSVSNPLDSGLRVFDAAGGQLAFDDNAGSPDPGLTFTAPADGPYYVGVSSAPDFAYDPLTPDSGADGGSTGPYTLSVARSPGTVSGDNGTLQTADVINGNANVRGVLGFPGDYFRLKVNTTGRLTAQITVGDGTTFSPRVVLYGAAGQLLIQEDATPSHPDSAQLTRGLEAGTYYLAVTSTVLPGGSGIDPAYVLTTTFDPAVSPFQALPTGQGPVALATGDFNHDGNLDLVTANQGAGTVSVLLGNGDGTFRPAVDYPVGTNPTSVATGRFTSSGNTDLVIANRGSSGDDAGSVSVLLGNGDGTFQPAQTFDVGPSPSSVAVGQFTSDGYDDVAVASFDDNSVTVLLGDGNGSFTADPNSPWGDGSFPVGRGPEAVAVAAFNGYLGIVTANSLDGTVTVLLGDGSGNFLPDPDSPSGDGSFSVQNGTDSSFSLVPTSVAVGQLTADGDVGIVTAGDSGFVSVLLGQGGAFGPAVV